MEMDRFYETLQSLSQDEVVLDVRTPEEYQEAHFPGSRNIPHDQVVQYGDELKNYKTVYIHCRSGGRAQRAYEALSEQGLTNLVCIGEWGMKHWLEKGYPVDQG